MEVSFYVQLQSLDTIGLWEAAKHELGEKVVFSLCDLYYSCQGLAVYLIGATA